MVRREVAEIKLSNGAQIPCRPVNGRVWAALFVGNVKRTFNPTTEIERDQLMRRFKNSLITADGKAVLFDFADSPRGSCRVKPHSEGKIFKKKHGRLLVFFKKYNSLNENILYAFLNNASNAAFHADIRLIKKTIA